MSTTIEKTLVVTWIVSFLALPVFAVLGLFLPSLPVQTIFAVDNTWILLGSNVAMVLIPLVTLSTGIFLSATHLNGAVKVVLGILGSIIVAIIVYYVNLIAVFLISGYLDTIFKPL